MIEDFSKNFIGVLFLEVSYGISHGMGILAYYVRFHDLALLYFLQSFTAYVFQPVHTWVHATGHVAEGTVSLVVGGAGSIQTFDGLFSSGEVVSVSRFVAHGPHYDGSVVTETFHLVLVALGE